VTGFDVDERHAGSRLDVVVAEELGESRSRAANRIAAGEVEVDGRVVSKHQRLAAGQRVEIAEAATPVATTPAPQLPPVRFEDEHLMVVAKPAGLVVHPGHGRPDGTLVDALLAAGVPLAPSGGEDRPGIVHRLDRDTSGLLLVAKSDHAHAALVEALRRREVERRYLALVDGEVAQARARIEAPLGRDPADRLRFAVVADGKPATTRYERLAVGRAEVADGSRGEVTLLACRLETGRTHQIRVHLAATGHPVCADRTYGADVRISRVLGLTRPFLHAASLALRHPITGQPLSLDEPVGDELRRAAELAGVGDALRRAEGGASADHEPGPTG
jgi:23S rRNA pseudouridine1911/1915/1917 synthase